MSAQPAKLYAVPRGQDIAFEVEEGYPLVPDDVYSAICVGYSIKQVFRTLKVFIDFRITEGPYTGTMLWRAYGVGGRIIPGKGPGSGPRPKIKRRSLLFRMLCRVLHLPINTKTRHVSLGELKNRLCKVSTRTVVQDHEQKTLSEIERYSVVNDVLSIEA